MRPQATLALWAFLIPLCSAVSCNQLSTPYDGPSNSQFEITCNSYSTGGNQIGPSFDSTDLESCIQMCGDTSNCKAALFDRSQFICYLMDGSDGPAPNNLYDMALLLESAPTTTTIDAISTTTDTDAVSTTTNAASATACDQLDDPSYIDGVKFSIFCGLQSTGGNVLEYTTQLHSLTECMEFCADIQLCRAVTFHNYYNECYLYDAFNGFMSDVEKDMAYVVSRPAVPSTTEAPTETSTTTSLPTTSTTAPSGPLSCSQMAGSIYTGPQENKFTLSCDTSSTGESIYRQDEEDSMKGCLDRCDSDSRCIAVKFLPPPHSECDLIESFAGTQASPGTDFAFKILSSTSTLASSETSVNVESTSGSTGSTLYMSSSASISSESQEIASSALTSETTSAVTTTSGVTSEATTSLFTSLSSSQDTPSGTKSDSALESTSASATSATTSLEATSLSTELPASTSIDSSSLSLESILESISTSDTLAITSLEATSLSTELLASISTDSLSLSSESVSVSPSDAQLVSTSAEESVSLEPTTVATSIGSVQTDTTNIEMSTAETSTTKPPSIETSTVQTPSTTISVTAIETTATASSASDTSRASTEIQSTSDASALPSTSSTPSASNIPTLGEYTFTGCLKSLEGYPSFKEVATDPEMTTRKCVELALGSEYIGVYQETCYKADVLDDTEFIVDGRCDLTCPGDRTLFCGGILRAGRKLLHRAIAPNHLLSLYRKEIPSTSDVSSSSSSAPTSSSSHAYESTSESSGPSHSSQTDASYSFSSFATKNTGSETLSVSDFTVTETKSETCLSTSLPTPTAIHTAYSTLTIGHAYTKTRFAETVTTVTYTTLNPSNPASLITTCVPITLLYSPCGFQYPSGWVGGHQTDVGGDSYPTGRPTGGSQPGSKNGQPEYPTVATGLQDSHPSYKPHQHVAPTSVGALNGDDQPEKVNPQPSVQTQGSAESNNNTLVKPSHASSPKGLTTETSIIATSQLGNSALPSEPSPLDQGQAPSESKGAPYTTSVVVSEAHRHDLTSWTMITALVGMLLL
ncbi:hypothetical protein FAGAP_13486 [Fusarium agapanthi]|uniref:Apple domain-containing protein n=1 Tax=Fusarium agapanthi TaxID=1803897 RepID=A0A9P5E2A2_9HYPO|nr:hypothetical protein FAGAP_13486 [Fusarium agapanthi]